MITWHKSFFIILALTIVLSIHPTLFANAQYMGRTESNTGNELTQIYENETADIKINYPANWFSETKNLVTPSIIHIFPMDFISERIPSVGLIINVLNGTQSGVSLNLTEMTDFFEATIIMNPDSRVMNSTINATLFNDTVPAWEAIYYDLSRPAFVTKEMTIGTMLPPNYNTGYFLEYYAEPKYFDKYLPQVQKIMDSLQLLRNITK